MKRLIIIFAILMLAAPAYAKVYTLAWDAVTTNEDGSPCTDLAGYRIYCSLVSGDYTEGVRLCRIDVGNVTQTDIEVAVEEGDTVHFVATAYDTNQNESQYSNEVFDTIPFLCPAAPGALRLVR